MESTSNNGKNGAGPAAMRAAMVVSQLRPNAVSDLRIVAAMARVPREAFLPRHLAGQAYCDTALALGNCRMANAPVATGRLLTEAGLRAGDKVLLIGAAGGYTAAILADLVAHVTAVESDPALATFARDALGGLANVAVVEGPLAAGYLAGAPYDVVVVDGAIEQVPQSLVDQLAVGGRMVAGIVDRGVTRLSAGQRTQGGFGLVDFADADCVALPGFSVPAGFVF
ncbi:MAG: protein-L-isoaspartate O-methyltransferase [Sphingomonas sp.]